MPEWTRGTVDRLFELYGQHCDRLERKVRQTNKSLGAADPEKFLWERFSRAQFAGALVYDGDDPLVIEQWLLRIVRCHEDEFPALQAASKGIAP